VNRKFTSQDVNFKDTNIHTQKDINFHDFKGLSVLLFMHFYQFDSESVTPVILMRIRILDPHWKKMEPDPGHFIPVLLIFFNKK